MKKWSGDGPDDGVLVVKQTSWKHFHEMDATTGLRLANTSPDMRVFIKSLTGGIRGFVGDSLNWNTVFGVHHARVVTNDSKYATMG